MPPPLIEGEQVEVVTYDSGSLSIRTTEGGSEVLIHRGMPVEAAVEALRSLARHLEFGVQIRADLRAGRTGNQ